MPMTTGRIDRTGTIVFHDASLSIWEDGISDARNAGGHEGERKWKRQFKRDVFARIVQTLNRLGWVCNLPEIRPHHIKHYGGNVARWSAESKRYCSKGDLKADLSISGRCIDLKFFQNVNAPDRPDHEGRYQSDKEKHMPYLLRLEMERTRRKVLNYLSHVFTDYTLGRQKIASPNPDPLVYFNDAWDGEYEKRRGTHRFNRGTDGWPSDKELASWSRKDKDGAILNHGDVRCMRDRKGRLLRGSVYGGINGMWMLVYGPDQRDHTHANAGEFFTYRPGETPRKVVDQRLRRKRLENELSKAVTGMKFERAAVLRDILFPNNPALFVVWHKGHQAFHKTGFSGYTSDLTQAGRFTADEVRGWNDHQNEVRPLNPESSSKAHSEKDTVCLTS